MLLTNCNRPITLATSSDRNILKRGGRQIPDDSMELELAAALKPGPFVKTEVGGPEQMLQDLRNYVKKFCKFWLATWMAEEHSQSYRKDYCPNKWSCSQV